MSVFGNDFASLRWGEEQGNTPVIVRQRIGNERLLPTDVYLRDKRFSIDLWCYLQVVSRCNHKDGFRYVSTKDTTLAKIRGAMMKMSKDSKTDTYVMKPISNDSIRKAFKYLQEIGLVVGIVHGKEVFSDYRGMYYQIRNEDVFE